MPITPDLIEAHGLKPDEYQRILDLIGREPSFTELGIFSAMWNEHCSYKSSKKWLRTLPTTGPRVIQGPGENAGVVDIGDGDCVVFKMESHNHPSYIEPYQGAATGVGGILRDVFTMGARPIAAMNALRFGAPDHPKTRHLVAGVVAGVGGYGNSFGVPTVGGEVNFDARYNGNILVNAFAAGLAKTDAIFLSEAKGVGLPVVYLGAKTGRDGVGGATMASAEFDDKIEEKRPTVQVGDPFTEKCLLEACLELMASGAVIAIQDMGAAGLTCSAVEMGAKGDLGIELDLDKVPVREERMSGLRDDAVGKPGAHAHGAAPREGRGSRGDLRQMGPRLRHRRQDDRRPALPRPAPGRAKSPTCRSRISATRRRNTTVRGSSRRSRAPLAAGDVPQADVADALLKMLGGPDLSSRRWVWEQYDTLIQGNSLQLPGGDAGVVRVDGHADQGAGLLLRRHAALLRGRPLRGRQAGGGRMLAQPDRHRRRAAGRHRQPQFRQSGAARNHGPARHGHQGHRRGLPRARLPDRLGQRLALQRDQRPGHPADPDHRRRRPAAGLVEDGAHRLCRAKTRRSCSSARPPAWGTHLGQSIYLRDIHGRTDGPPPPVDLAHEKRVGDFVRELIRDGVASPPCTTVSDGGLAVALAEMAMASGIGADRRPASTMPTRSPSSSARTRAAIS